MTFAPAAGCSERLWTLKADLPRAVPVAETSPADEEKAGQPLRTRKRLKPAPAQRTSARSALPVSLEEHP